MEKTRLAWLVPIATLALAVPVWLAAGRGTTAQDLLPTPEGQLGGAPSLQTAPPATELTPPPTPDEEEPDVPDPSECEVRPRTVDELMALAATPAASADSAAAATPEAVTAGEPADPIVANAVGYTIREAVACANAGETMRLWALFSDGFLQQSAARTGGFDEQFLRAMSEQRPRRNDPMPRVGDVLLLPDGRAAARVVPVDDRVVFALATSGESLVLFVAVDGRWLVDDIRDLSRS